MAITAPVLAGYTLPYTSGVDGFSYSPAYRGGSVRLGNGTLAYDLVNDTVKRTFELTWRHVTEAQRDTINTAYNAIRKTSAAFTAPDGQTATVNRAEDQTDLRWGTKLASGGRVLWSATLRLEEV